MHGRRLPIRLNIFLLCLVPALGNALFAQVVNAAPLQHKVTPSLEIVEVTARKRLQRAQQVPLSIAYVSGETMSRLNLHGVSDLSGYVSGLYYLETGISTQFRIRGIGSDISQGFEQSVGMYVDGVYFGRAHLFRMPMMDMQGVEVLRGPQSTLFGKNSIAGALNLTSARPTDVFTGRLSYRYRTEHRAEESNLVLSGPVNDALRLRLAARYLEDDGWLQNDSLQRDEPDKREVALRLGMDWDINPWLNLYLKAEDNQLAGGGRNAEITYDESLVGGPSFSQSLAALGYPGIDTAIDSHRQTNLGDASDSTIQDYTAIATMMLADYQLQAIAGWVEYDYKDRCDCDFVSAEIINLNSREDYQQQSLELRLQSPTGVAIDWLLGAYYQQYEQNFTDRSDVYADNLIALTTIPALANTGMRREFSQDSNSWAVFGDLGWQFTPQLRVGVSARYTEEKKTADKRLDVVDAGTDHVRNDPLAGYAYLSAFGIENEQALWIPVPGPPSGWLPLAYSGHNVSASRDESAFLPAVYLQYQPTERALYYIQWSTGFKAGGFDPRSNRVGSFSTASASGAESNPLLYFEFEEEEANTLEVGAKFRYLEGRAETAIAAFYTEYDDLQTSQYDGKIGYDVGNVSAIVIQGIEVEGRHRLSETLAGRYSITLLDAEYEDFQSGNCYIGQTPDGIDRDGDGNVDTCDYSGKRPPYAPEFSLNLGLDYVQPLGPGLDGFLLLDVQHVGRHQVHVNLDPEGQVDDYTLVNAQVGVRYQSLRLALQGSNLLDEEIRSYSGNVPLAASPPFLANTQVSWMAPPRLFSVELSYQF